ncbi:MAG: tripartite tricarboxylate transporter TctB family protein [Alphaproteobacteria bacterium]|nr:tripartite tricarboxylate transporter TctB family protein [Alphaproteobacteria bacterium]
MRFHDAFNGLVLLLAAIALLVYSLTLPAMQGQQFGPGVFPLMVSVGLGACALLLMARAVAAGWSGPFVAVDAGLRSRRGLTAVLAVVLGTVAYLLLSDFLGFLVVAPLVLVAIFRSQRVGWPAAIAVALLGTAVIHFVFYSMLRVPLPWGLLTPLAW